jgi:hypothetical protein
LTSPPPASWSSGSIKKLIKPGLDPLPAASLPARGALLLADPPSPMQASCTPWLPWATAKAAAHGDKRGRPMAPRDRGRATDLSGRPGSGRAGHLAASRWLPGFYCKWGAGRYLHTCRQKYCACAGGETEYTVCETRTTCIWCDLLS